mmetsp:Transcript_41883/g.76106  ORF Transcript_41883/g.76106 Transcript_41883/m.76106 type:complete len:261 (-) Transcript_41883:76-858(-)
MSYSSGMHGSFSPTRLALKVLVVAVGTRLLDPGCAFTGTLTPKSPRRMRTVAGVGAGYLERNPAKATDSPFNPVAAAYERIEVEFKQRPFGILRYQPGQNGKGAMAMEVIPEARYPGDPLAQAALGGVKPGMVVAGIDGIDTRSVDFEKIMDLLDDEAIDVRYRPHQATTDVRAVLNGQKPMTMELPVTVWFSNIPGYQYTGSSLVLDKTKGWVTQDDKGSQAAGLLSKLTEQQLQRVRGLLSAEVLDRIRKYAKQMNKL